MVVSHAGAGGLSGAHQPSSWSSRQGRSAAVSPRGGWAAGTLVLAVSTALWLAVPGAEARAAPSRAQQSAARRLVDAYAPITMLRAAKDPSCHTGADRDRLGRDR